ncbi:zinc ABC transporter solute-binding protein [Clostridium sp. P21]|uniref:Zinc ABC transporter solute-binding protein n=1 Tax=Clostridium muellerianum TaxID=2716538 RepID=A0A7Y0EKY4_9CLOT|nr:zinc ABC transporter substrate-binding protein [Clostridium muellerianum]NMM65393.1 zinc ABC transporter solute-binding protein [Clostridium muellerianum]
MKNAVLLFFCIILLSGCGYQIQNKPVKPDNDVVKMETRKDIELNITTTNKLLYSMVKTISKNMHSVDYIFKNRDTEQNFEFTSDSLNNIAKKDLLIYMGAGFEPWIDDFIDKLNKSKVGVINVSRGVKLLSYNKEVKYKNAVLKDNCYYLMNIDNYKIALLNIKNAIQDKDPKNRDLYQKNFSEAIKNVEEYQKDLKTISGKLKDCNFIFAEDEMNYFIKYNDFNAIYTSKDSNGKWDLEDKVKNSKNLVFLYNNPLILKENEEIIKKYSIKAVNIKIYNGEVNYEDIVKSNLEALKNSYESGAVKK